MSGDPEASGGPTGVHATGPDWEHSWSDGEEGMEMSPIGGVRPSAKSTEVIVQEALSIIESKETGTEEKAEKAGKELTSTSDLSKQGTSDSVGRKQSADEYEIDFGVELSKSAHKKNVSGFNSYSMCVNGPTPLSSAHQRMESLESGKRLSQLQTIESTTTKLDEVDEGYDKPSISDKPSIPFTRELTKILPLRQPPRVCCGGRLVLIGALMSSHENPGCYIRIWQNYVVYPLLETFKLKFLVMYMFLVYEVMAAVIMTHVMVLCVFKTAQKDHWATASFKGEFMVSIEASLLMCTIMLLLNIPSVIITLDGLRTDVWTLTTLRPSGLLSRDDPTQPFVPKDLWFKHWHTRVFLRIMHIAPKRVKTWARDPSSIDDVIVVSMVFFPTIYTIARMFLDIRTTDFIQHTLASFLFGAFLGGSPIVVVTFLVQVIRRAGSIASQWKEAAARSNGFISRLLCGSRPLLFLLSFCIVVMGTFPIIISFAVTDPGLSVGLGLLLFSCMITLIHKVTFVKKLNMVIGHVRQPSVQTTKQKDKQRDLDEKESLEQLDNSRCCCCMLSHGIFLFFASLIFIGTLALTLEPEGGFVQKSKGNFFNLFDLQPDQTLDAYQSLVGAEGKQWKLVRPGLCFDNRRPNGMPTNGQESLEALSVLDLSLFSVLAYKPREQVHEVLPYYFNTTTAWNGTKPIMGPGKVASPNQWYLRGEQPINTPCFFYDFYNPQMNLSIIAIRGTKDAYDLLADAALFLDLLLDSLLVLPKSVQKQMSIIVDGPSKLFFYDKNWYFAPLLKYAEEASKTRRVITTGHSLGGALAQIAAINIKSSTVAFASPGMRLRVSKLGLDPAALYKGATNIHLDRDIKIGTPAGTVHELICPKAIQFTECHPMIEYACAIYHACGDDRGRPLVAKQCEKRPFFPRRELAGALPRAYQSDADGMGAVNATNTTTAAATATTKIATTGSTTEGTGKATTTTGATPATITTNATTTTQATTATTTTTVPETTTTTVTTTTKGQ